MRFSTKWIKHAVPTAIIVFLGFPMLYMFAEKFIPPNRSEIRYTPPQDDGESVDDRNLCRSEAQTEYEIGLEYHENRKKLQARLAKRLEECEKSTKVDGAKS